MSDDIHATGTVETTLVSLGFEPPQVKVYLALLELGEATVLPIAKHSGVQRTYCYAILDSLMEQGLASYIERNGRRRYSAAPPERLTALLERRLQAVQTILPELKGLHNQRPGKPKVLFFEGEAGIKAVYDDMLTAKRIDAIASPRQILRALPDYFPAYAAKQLKRNIPVRELISQEPLPGESYTDQYGAKQEVRPLPPSVSLKTDLVLYDKKLALISYAPVLHALVIEDSAIVETHRALFDVLWHLSDWQK